MTGLDNYRPLGRSELRVSPLALGAMTFGDIGLCSDDDTSRKVFHTYLEAGGNFIDTANNYSDGRSEELVGEFIRDAGVRDDIVLATKYSGPRFADGERAGDPHRSNGRANMVASLEGSLRRLGVDHIDLYWLHIWDGRTPAEEVMAAFDELVRSGKIRAAGLSDVPAWYAAKAAMLGGPPITAMQLAYSLVERSIENEHVVLAQEFGIAVQPWGAIGGGFLSGKYTRDGDRAAGNGRLAGDSAGGDADRRWAVLDVVREVAAEAGCTPAQVAMHWVVRRPGVHGTLAGARSPEQLTETVGALGLDLGIDQLDRLTEAADTPLPFPQNVITQFNGVREPVMP